MIDTFYNDEFLDQLPQNPIYAGIEICKQYFQGYNAYENNELIYPACIDALTLLKEFCKAHGLEFQFPALSAEKNNNCVTITNAIHSVGARLRQMATDSETKEAEKKAFGRFASRFQTTLVYTFTDNDLFRVQTLINELRTAVMQLKGLEEGHKQRILKRIEQLQQEMHKRMTDLDRVWGFVAETGVLISKFGNDAKPIVDRVRELSDIVWKVVVVTENLKGNPLPPLPPSNG